MAFNFTFNSAVFSLPKTCPRDRGNKQPCQCRHYVQRRPPGLVSQFPQFPRNSLTFSSQNGVGAFILQCKRLEFHYCDHWSSSKGMKFVPPSPSPPLSYPLSSPTNPPPPIQTIPPLRPLPLLRPRPPPNPNPHLPAPKHAPHHPRPIHQRP